MPLLAQGEFALVKKHLNAVGDKTDGSRLSSGENDLNYVRVEMAVQQRDEYALRRYAPLAAETAARDGHMLYQAVAQRALGVLQRLTGDYAQAENHLQQALQTFEELETRWQLGRTLVELGEVAAAQSDCVRARAYYVRAIEAFDAMGVVPDKERAQTALAELE